MDFQESNTNNEIVSLQKRIVYIGCQLTKSVLMTAAFNREYQLVTVLNVGELSPLFVEF